MILKSIKNKQFISTQPGNLTYKITIVYENEQGLEEEVEFISRETDNYGLGPEVRQMIEDAQ